jgi:dTDP-4-dehydrorhamnose 3,5-epimerase-like enzyme
MKGVKVRYLNEITDERGRLLEILTYKELCESKFGHLHLTIINPKQTRGGHYHKSKREWFFLLKGKSNLIVENLNTKEKESIILTDKKPSVIEIEPFVIHTFTNKTNEEAFLLVYNNKSFDRKSQDTYKK